MLSFPKLALSALAATTAVATDINDFSCKSSYNPVVLLHGLGATSYEDLNYMQCWLQVQGFCTYAKTYGAYDGFPLLGGLKAINESAPEIAAYIKEVVEKTGKSKVDLVGHSEGAFQSLYVPKFEGVAHLIDKIASIAPPTHATTFADIYELAYKFGNESRAAVGEILDTVGCPACNDLGPDGPAVKRLNDDGYSPSTSFISEEGVINRWIQDSCPLDPVGHIGEAYDLNVWHLVKNVLTSTPDKKFLCLLGSPGK
ncbi:hypothetical protein PDIDSM_5265 [Penicillium digitatum]|nr:hypothetical protein PDIDSM_5265 [Penicillium digitatum]